MFFTDYFTFKERGEGWVLLEGRERNGKAEDRSLGNSNAARGARARQEEPLVIPVLPSCLTPLQTRLAGTRSSTLSSQPLCSGQETSRSHVRAGLWGSSWLDDDQRLFTASTAPQQTLGLPQSPRTGLSQPRPREEILLCTFALTWEHTCREQRAQLLCAAPGSSGLPSRAITLP